MEYVKAHSAPSKAEILAVRQLIREKQKNAQKPKDFYDGRHDMAFIKADLNKELEELNELVNDNEEARKAYEAFQKRIALQEQLLQIRKAENMTQTDVANAAGLSQQAVSRIEKGAGATINSLIKYLTGIGYCIQFKKI